MFHLGQRFLFCTSPPEAVMSSKLEGRQVAQECSGKRIFRPLKFNRRALVSQMQPNTSSHSFTSVITNSKSSSSFVRSFSASFSPIVVAASDSSTSSNEKFWASYGLVAYENIYSLMKFSRSSRNKDNYSFTSNFHCLALARVDPRWLKILLWTVYRVCVVSMSASGYSIYKLNAHPLDIYKIISMHQTRREIMTAPSLSACGEHRLCKSVKIKGASSSSSSPCFSTSIMSTPPPLKRAICWSCELRPSRWPELTSNRQESFAFSKSPSASSSESAPPSLWKIVRGWSMMPKKIEILKFSSICGCPLDHSNMETFRMLVHTRTQ